MCTSVRSVRGWMYCQHLSSAVVWLVVCGVVWSVHITGIIRGDISISEYQITADYSRPGQAKTREHFRWIFWKFLN